jgi:hypothetical protein
MNREDIIKLAREAGFDPHDMSDDFTCNLEDIERFAALAVAAEREKVAQWMMRQGYATGHGDTVEDLLKELEWQIREREREACAKVCEERQEVFEKYYTKGLAAMCAEAIRARGNNG